MFPQTRASPVCCLIRSSSLSRCFSGRSQIRSISREACRSSSASCAACLSADAAHAASRYAEATAAPTRIVRCHLRVGGVPAGRPPMSARFIDVVHPRWGRLRCDSSSGWSQRQKSTSLLSPSATDGPCPRGAFANRDHDAEALSADRIPERQCWLIVADCCHPDRLRDETRGEGCRIDKLRGHVLRQRSTRGVEHHGPLVRCHCLQMHLTAGRNRAMTVTAI